MSSTLKSQALRAGDDLSAMYEAADAIKRSATASGEQIEAASAVRRSIAAVMTLRTDLRVQVARQRFAKLVALL